MRKSVCAYALTACLLSGALFGCGSAQTEASAASAATSVSEQTAQVSAEEESGDIQYVLYLGTNDKESGEPVFTEDDAKAQLKDVLAKHVGGWTIQEAEGGWTDDKGELCKEYTLVIYLSDTDLDTVHATCDELIQVFNQSSILIQQNSTTTEFYSGAAQE